MRSIKIGQTEANYFKSLFEDSCFLYFSFGETKGLNISQNGWDHQIISIKNFHLFNLSKCYYHKKYKK